MSSSPGRDVHARANAPYSWRAPSPPPVNIPAILGGECKALQLVTSYANIDSAYLTAEDLQVIAAGNSTDISASIEADPDYRMPYGGLNWSYARRREAQRVLNFMFLGPLAKARDQDWLRKEGISLVMVARDETQMQQRFLTVDRACDGLGIPVVYVDISAKWEMVRQFPHIIRQINDHLIGVYQLRSAAMAAGLPRESADDAQKRHGRVVIVCESGNDRSPAVVAAYIMAVFGLSVGEAIKFVTLHRFSCSFDETMKQLLQSWGDIVHARRQVHAAELAAAVAAGASGHGGEATAGAGADAVAAPRQAKRGISEMMTDDGDDDGGEDAVGMVTHDAARFEDREPFAPFVDADAQV